MTSIRGDRTTVFREREVERDYEEAPRRHYTTVKRYQVPESISRTLHKGEDEEVKEKIIVKRTERREDPPPPPSSHHHDDFEYKVTERRYESSPQPSRAASRRDRDEVDFRFVERRTERSADPPRRDISYRVIERDSDYERPRSEYRVVEKETDIVRAPSPPSPERVTREYRFERERSISPPRERPYDLERYSKSTEYFAQPQPQPIIIRESAPQAPIIIREERREPQKIIIRREVQEPQYEFVERKEVIEEKEESRSLVKREEPPPPAEPTPQPEKQPEEDYFYERRVIERRRRSDSYDRKTEIRPRDSASNYSSDDSYEYVRREKIVGDDRDNHHRRHLAEGAIAGIGAAEILRHHRKSEGKPVSGRGRSAIGGAAVGALGAEALTRVRSMRSLRRDSSSRSRSGDRAHRRRRPTNRSRSRSQSWSRAQQLGGLAAVAAVGALAGYALKNRGNKETVIVNDGRPPRRSRSRRRRYSADTYNSEPMGEHRDPDHRNRRIAQAGLASAAAAGIWEKVRSKSRGGRHRSKSRIREGVPIAAAGLGGAALAGLYEKNKANKEAKKDAIIEDELGRGRRRHSRSRSRTYGRDPIHPDDRPYYSDEEPGLYRRRGGSSGSSPDTRRQRSRSRGRHIAEGAAAAGGVGLAAHEYNKNRSRSRSRSRVHADRDRRRQEDEYYGDRGYGNEQYSPPPMVQNGYAAPPPNAPYGQQTQGYPGGNYFPPPPTGENVQSDPQYAHQGGYPAYNPADYAQQGAPHAHPYDTSRGVYNESDATLGQAYPNDTYAGDARYGADEHGRGRGRPDPENMV